jgi:hypothetical protein
MNSFLRQPASHTGSSAIADKHRHSLTPEIYLQFQVQSEHDGKLKDVSKVAVMSYVLRSMGHQPNLRDRFALYVLVNQCSELEKRQTANAETHTHHSAHHRPLKLTSQQQDDCCRGGRILGRHDHGLLDNIEQESKEETLQELFETLKQHDGKGCVELKQATEHGNSCKQTASDNK